MDIKQYIYEFIVKQSIKISHDVELFPTFKKAFKKNDLITDFGQIERKAYFLIDGIVESNITKNGEIKINDFIFPNCFFCSTSSFITQTPSELQLRALVDCEVEYIMKDDLDKAQKISIIANQFSQFVTNEYLLRKIKRENDFLTKSSKELYLDLLKKQPEIIKHISIKKIAKYLGIHPESLSRIRSEIF